MATKRTGKGLAAVFQTASGGKYQELPLIQIVPNKNQPRKEFNKEKLEELIASIKEVGILQPVVVRGQGDEYELIAGERRFRAATEAGLSSIPAVIRTTEDRGSLEQALAENLHRAELNPLEEAAAYQSLIDDFGLTQQEVADRLQKNRATIANTIRLIELPVSIQKLLIEGALSAGHARALLAINSAKKQLVVANKVIKENWSVRKLEAYTQDVKAPKPKGNKTRSAVVLELENLLEEYLATRVKVQIQSNEKGKVQIEFFGLDDLERIYRKIQGD